MNHPVLIATAVAACLSAAEVPQVESSLRLLEAREAALAGTTLRYEWTDNLKWEANDFDPTYGGKVYAPEILKKLNHGAGSGSVSGQMLVDRGQSWIKMSGEVPVINVDKNAASTFAFEDYYARGAMLKVERTFLDEPKRVSAVLITGTKFEPLAVSHPRAGNSLGYYYYPVIASSSLRHFYDFQWSLHKDGSLIGDACSPDGVPTGVLGSCMRAKVHIADGVIDRFEYGNPDSPQSVITVTEFKVVNGHRIPSRFDVRYDVGNKSAPSSSHALTFTLKEVSKSRLVGPDIPDGTQVLDWRHCGSDYTVGTFPPAGCVPAKYAWKGELEDHKPSVFSGWGGAPPWAYLALSSALLGVSGRFLRRSRLDRRTPKEPPSGSG